MIKPRVVIYIRVSDPTQIDNNSLETQENSCRKYAENNGYELVEPLFKDEGISAKNFQKRPGVRDLLYFCTLKKNNIQKVIVYKMDRWTRNVEEGLAAISLLSKSGVVLESATEATSENPMGRAMRTILMAIGELDNGLKSERVKDNLKTMFLEKGLWCWGAPIGYKRPGGSKEERKGKVCIIDENLGPIVKTMFMEAVKGTKNKTEIAKIANNLGFGKYTNKEADCGLVSKIIKKTFYYGYMYAPKWKEYAWGKHEPLINEETWQKANQTLFGGNRKYQTQDIDIFPLKGLLKCGNCGHLFTTSNPRGQFEYYECKQKNCSKQERILVNKAHEQFIEIFKGIKPTEEVIKLFNHMVFYQWDQSIENQKNQIEEYKIQIKKIEDSITGFSESNRKGILSDSEAVERVGKARAEIAVLKIEAGDIKIEKYDSEITKNFIEAFLLNLDQLWVNLNLTKKQLLQNKIFPDGLISSNKTIRTGNLSPSFRYIESLKQQNLNWVTLRGIEPRLAE